MDRVPNGENIEGAPTLVYEVWDWYYSSPGPRTWRFIGYRALSLRQVLRYQDFGYHVERSRRDDRGGTTPLFPRLEASGLYPRGWLDTVSVSESGAPGRAPLVLDQS